MQETISIAARFESFFEQFEGELQQRALSYPQERSVEIDWERLSRFDPTLADELLGQPDAYLKEAERSLENLHIAAPNDLLFKPHVRIFNLPSVCEAMVERLGAEHLDKLVKVEGAVSWIAEIKPLLKRAGWACIFCDSKIFSEVDRFHVKPPAVQCKCGRSEWALSESESTFLNVQRGQMQELVEKLRGSAPTAHVQLWMEDDLANRITPGEKIQITGILRLRPIKEGRGKQAIYDKVLDILHIKKLEQEFEALEISAEEENKIRDLSKHPHLFEQIVKSIAPSIYGYEEMKAAIALQLFGGTPDKKLPDGQPIRNDIHLLLIGDPSTGKSSMLQYVARVAPKCINTAGKGSSTAGLTASAERDEQLGGWILKAGAMVLANGGQVNVDELDKMDPEDRSALHQAMEQQFVSIAKAGIVTQFPTKAAVLAAANPKLGRFDPNSPPAAQFDIPPTLLSRFDLIFAIKDPQDESHHKKMAEHILLGHRIAAEKTQAEQGSPILPAIDPEFLRKYIAYARRNVFPTLTEEAAEKIGEYYLEMRRLGRQQNNFPITARQIEGLIRLAEASSKMRLSEKVELLDAERAINLVNFVLNDIFVDRETGRIDSDIINVGQPKSRLDKVRAVMNVINDLEKKFDLVPIEDVIKEASAFGMEERYIRELLDQLKRQGDLYEPKHGHIKTSRGKSW